MELDLEPGEGKSGLVRMLGELQRSMLQWVLSKQVLQS